ncbi:hypothetical protein BCV72DRAFT_251710 [Rhizopus microsporus var. microsporus]|uniref:Uncharacterized protein n=1 Tax=Rhizopus microsporus var. microsporus TaxID=86635 RepID=A0A1X0QV82_RHIZD|nr:hypothetical protein BCV72DRAFT_251710 [Rhizopus microsporus var. microsporus]
MEDILTQTTNPNIVFGLLPIKMKAITKANSKRATTYNEYNDMTREKFIDRMLESSEEKGRIPRFAKEFDIETQTKVPYKLSEKRTGRKSSFTFEHKDLLGFTLQTQLNQHLRNNMLVTVKRRTFEPEFRNSADNLQTRYEWFMK